MYIVPPSLRFIFVYVIILIIYGTGIELALCVYILLLAALIAAYAIFQGLGEEYLTTDLTGAEIQAPLYKSGVVIQEYRQK